MATQAKRTSTWWRVDSEQGLLLMVAALVLLGTTAIVALTGG